ncbi:Beta-xylosidase [compost metagenome]
MEFEPESFTQMAGLVLYYDESDHFYLRVSHDEELGKHLAVIISKQGGYDEADDYIKVAAGERCYLKAVIRYEHARFYYSQNGTDWHGIGPKLYMGVLADEYMRKLSFTGGFAGVCVQDLRGTALPADFDYVSYRELGEAEPHNRPYGFRHETDKRVNRL